MGMDTMEMVWENNMGSLEAFFDKERNSPLFMIEKGLFSNLKLLSKKAAV